VNILKVLENINKENFEECLQSNVCEPKFRRTTDADNISAATEQRDMEENEKDDSNEGTVITLMRAQQYSMLILC
jgi:hypothetical protein